MRTVLPNLVGNAWQIHRHAIIDIGYTEIQAECTFFVRDNGKGFGMANAKEIFAPFKSLPGADPFRGFGGGLATVDRIIRRHGGRIWADSEPGKGATFNFTLPEGG